MKKLQIICTFFWMLNCIDALAMRPLQQPFRQDENDAKYLYVQPGQTPTNAEQSRPSLHRVPTPYYPNHAIQTQANHHARQQLIPAPEDQSMEQEIYVNQHGVICPRSAVTCCKKTCVCAIVAIGIVTGSLFIWKLLEQMCPHDVDVQPKDD